MIQKNVASLLFVFVLALSLLAGCGSESSDPAEPQQTDNTTTDETQGAAEQLLVDLTGTIRSFGRWSWLTNMRTFG